MAKERVGMRALLWGILAIAGLWSGYWWVGSTAVERSAVDWFAAQSAQGLQASHDGIGVQGFPNRFDLTVTAPNLSDPARGLGWTAPFVQIFAMTWKPWHLIAALPNTQEVTVADQTVTITSTHMLASLLLHPGTALALNETRLDAAEVGFASSLGWSLTAAQINASTLQDATRADTHRLGLAVNAVTLGADLARTVAPADLPARIDLIHLDAYARLTAPIDRLAAQTRPALAALDLADVRLIWGALKLTAKGALKADGSGFAQGEIALRIEGFRRIPPLLVALNLVKPELAPTLARALEVLAEGAADANVLEITLKCADGRMSLGPVPLGSAPQFN
jgi:hypothetical protein